MNLEHPHDSHGYTHGKYIENDPVKYEIQAEEIVITSRQPCHFHDDVELIYVLEGDAELTVNSEVNHISPGNLIMFMPNHVHSIAPKGVSIRIYQCHISLGFLLFSAISRVTEKHVSYSLAYGNTIARIPIEEQANMQKDFADLIQEINSENFLNTMVGACIISKIIILFTRYLVLAIQKDEILTIT